MSDPARWTTPAAVTAAVQRRWNDGSLARAFAAGAAFPVIDLPLRGPAGADLGAHFDAARSWADDIRRGSRDGRAYTIVHGRIGGRVAGGTAVPSRVRVESFTQAWRLIGHEADAATYRGLLETAERVPVAREWALGDPIGAIAVFEEWTAILAAYEWLHDHRNSGLYLRQLSAVGVDTKFVERHRPTLAAMLGVPASASSFTRGLGLATKPTFVRMRFDPTVLGVPAGTTEAVLRAEEVRSWRVRPATALIVENEVSYLSAAVPERGVVLWGKGYDANVPASLEWLADVPVSYWGDLDTHGFGILHRVRSRLAHAMSVLMDRETLLAHEDRWGREESAITSKLDLLHDPEAALYSDLVTDRFGPRVRLEQERIDWTWASERLARGG